MDNPAVVSSKPLRRRSIPRWIGLIIFAAGFWLVHIVFPQHLSRLTQRHGWVRGRPGNWNWLGLIWVVAGIACAIWAMFVHTAQAPKGWEWERTPNYLLRRAPYTLTRNPIYLAELALWLGWAVLYGSVIVLVGFMLLCLVVGVLAPREERALEAKFGDTYREYKTRVPRWLGLPGRRIERGS